MPRRRGPVADAAHPLVRQLLALIPRTANCRELAARAGYAEGTLYAWNSVVRAPSLAAFCDFLDVLGYELVIVPKGDVQRRGG